MAERTSRRRKKKDEGQADKPSDEETAIGKYLRFNLATKTSNFMGHKVEYFTGSKAVDRMLDSKWASGKGSTDILFTDRVSVVHYLDRLLHKGMFHRALKVVKKSKKDDKKDKDVKKEGKEKGSKKEDTKTKKETKDKSEKDGAEKEDGTPKAKKAKEGKKKIKLEPTEDQVFRDGNDAYVWIYDPIKPMYYVYGLLLVVGAIGVCLFPLWPPWMRAGTYYLSLGGAGIVGSILALAVVRFILYVLMWGGTIGRVHLWIFPNLLADVGILESFQPFYEYTINKPEDATAITDSRSADNDEKEDATETDHRESETKVEEIGKGDPGGEADDGTEGNRGGDDAGDGVDCGDEGNRGDDDAGDGVDDGDEGNRGDDDAGDGVDDGDEGNRGDDDAGDDGAEGNCGDDDGSDEGNRGDDDAGDDGAEGNRGDDDAGDGGDEGKRGDDDAVDEVEEESSRSSSNQDNREEFEFINQDDISAASEEP